MSRYVLLHHDWPTQHFDLMIEVDGKLHTWRLPAPPAAGEQVVDRIANHRLDYLQYEGPVSNNRGQVKRVAKGDYGIVVSNQNEYQLKLTGDLEGEMKLERYQPNALAREASRAENINAYATPWLLVWTPS